MILIILGLEGLTILSVILNDSSDSMSISSRMCEVRIGEYFFQVSNARFAAEMSNTRKSLPYRKTGPGLHPRVNILGKAPKSVPLCRLVDGAILHVNCDIELDINS